MKSLLTTALLLIITQLSIAQDLRATLLQQLKNTHNKEEWYAPLDVAVKGLTAEQASWKDSGENHSVGQLTHHIVFWNERVLAQLKGEKVADFKGSNDETFDKFDKKTWDDLLKRLEAVLTGLEKVIADANEEQLKAMAPTIANVSVHNAYHTGQIVYARKLQKVWNPKK
jgi:uncharacterized damage-inducible protein DinB